MKNLTLLIKIILPVNLMVMLLMPSSGLSAVTLGISTGVNWGFLSYITLFRYRFSRCDNSVFSQLGGIVLSIAISFLCGFLFERIVKFYDESTITGFISYAIGTIFGLFFGYVSGCRFGKNANALGIISLVFVLSIIIYIPIFIIGLMHIIVDVNPFILYIPMILTGTITVLFIRRHEEAAFSPSPFPSRILTINEIGFIILIYLHTISHSIILF